MRMLEDEQVPEEDPSGPEKASDSTAGCTVAAASQNSDERPPLPLPLCPLCAFLQPGIKFKGTQKVPTNREDAWIVGVTIQGYDHERGYICGSMEAQNLPTSDETVITFWEGEIVDNINYSFFTGRWDATRAKDIEHWGKFQPFRQYKEAVITGNGGRSLDMSTSRFVFMRWKEQFFVNVSPDCGLTIAGFYYLCFDRQQGRIEGYYHDANSSPWQKLDLSVTPGASGFEFPAYSFA